MTATPFFQMRPSTPSAATRAELMQQAAALLDPAAPTQPEYADCTLTADDEIAIRPFSIVRLLNSNPCYPMFARVLKIYTNDTLKLQSLCVPAVQWRERVEDVVLVDGVA